MTAATLLVLWGLGWVWFAAALAFHEKPATPPKSEAIIVLTGGNGRINAGLDLLSQGIAPKLFISGVYQGTTEQDIFDSWKNKHGKVALPCCVTLGHKAVDTSGNAEEVREWVTEQGIKSLTLVTSQYHMPRAYLQLSRVLPDAEIFRYNIESNEFTPWRGRFWTLSFSEYNKTLIQWFRFEA